mmetsp:Transcript_693/g.1806  ORF Transcript_693/g.1806 Transcript_693/m.1806 type:complete len:301 (+) Transcript_693:869-1771(+)
MKTSAMPASKAHTTVATERMRPCTRSNESIEARTSRCSLYTRSIALTNSSSVSVALVKSETTCVRSCLENFSPPVRLSAASAHSRSRIERLSVGWGMLPPPSVEPAPGEVRSAVALVGFAAVAACAIAFCAADAAVCASSSCCLMKSWNARRAFLRVSLSVLSRPSPIVSTITAYCPPRLKIDASNRPPSSESVSARETGACCASLGSVPCPAPFKGKGLCESLAALRGEPLGCSEFTPTERPRDAPRPRFLCRRCEIARASWKRMRTIRSESTVCCTRSSKWRERRWERAPESDACSSA